MNKLEFTNKVIDNLNDCIHEDGKVGLAKFIELTNKLYEAINYTHSCTELNFLNINKMDKTTKKELDELVQTVSKTLIATMNVLDLKTHIEMTSVCDGYRYKLRFDKEKI